MEWYIISILIAVTYIIYIIISQYLYEKYNLDNITIFVNTLIIASICCIIIYPKKVTFSLNYKYLLIFIVGISLFFQNYFLQYGINMNYNVGLIDGLAIAIYLPIVTFLLHVIFKEKITPIKCIGILLVSVGSYLILC
tara:strand:+ start:920 stop:1333 length:414 start_codon:yes stop_codon:yes gene_type:complete